MQSLLPLSVGRNQYDYISMKTSPGLLFSVVLLVLMAAALLGGQLWALTGSVPVGLAAAAAAAALLGAGARTLLRRFAPGGRQFFGEYRGSLEAEDFAEVGQIVSEAGPKGKIRLGVQERPDRVASSVRSILGDVSSGKGKRRGE